MENRLPVSVVTQTSDFQEWITDVKQAMAVFTKRHSITSQKTYLQILSM
jgi:hypothetical protein